MAHDVLGNKMTVVRYAELRSLGGGHGNVVLGGA